MTLKDRAVIFLRSTERYTKTDMVYLASAGTWAILGNLAIGAISLGSAYVFANFLTKETYGTYQYILSVADLFGLLILSGIDTALARSVARAKEGSVYDAIRSKIAWGLIGGAGSAILGAYYFFQGNSILGAAFVITGIFIPFWETPGIFANYLQGKKEFKWQNIFSVFVQGFAALVTVATILLTHNLLIILGAYLCGWGLGRLGALWFTLRKFPPNKEHDPELVPYGKHLSVMMVFTTASSQIDTVLLWQFLGPAAIAVYYFSQTIPAKIAETGKMLNRILFSTMASHKLEETRRILPKQIALACMVSGFIGLLYFFIAPHLFAIFFPKYLSSVPYTQVLSLLIVLQPFSLLSSSFTAQARTKTLYIYNAILPFIRISLFFTLIPAFGLWGAVSGLIGVKLMDSVLLMVLFARSVRNR